VAKEQSIKSTRVGLRVVTEFGNLHSDYLPASRVMLYATDRSRSGALTAEPHSYEIERRDLRLRYRVDPVKRTFQSIPMLQLLSPEESASFLRSGEAWRKRLPHLEKEPTREYKVTTHFEKLPETRDFFGCPAFRWKTTTRSMRETPFGECWSESVTDAWYLDSAQLQALYPGFHSSLVPHAFALVKSGDEKLIMEHTGEKPTGLCAYSSADSVSHTPGPNGREMERRSTSFSRITSLTAERFEEWFFQPPYGYRKIPVYPGRLQLAMSDVRRSWNNLRWRMRKTA
jgi:hypothetical protein